MPIVSKKEFSEMAGIQAKHISTYKKRGEIEIRPDGNLDTNRPLNKLFIEKKKAKSPDVQTVIKEIAKTPAPAFQDDETFAKYQAKVERDAEKLERGEDMGDGEDIPDLAVSTQLEKHLKNIKIQSEINLLRLKEQKMQGEVVPAGAIAPVFLQHNQSIITSYNIATEELLTIFGKQYSVTIEHRAAMREQMTEAINTAMEKAIKATSQSVEAVIKNYTASRGVGERT